MHTSDPTDLRGQVPFAERCRKRRTSEEVTGFKAGASYIAAFC